MEEEIQIDEKFMGMSPEEIKHHYELLLEEKMEKIMKLQTEISDKTAEISDLKSQNSDKTAEISDLKSQNSDKTAEISDLKSQNNKISSNVRSLEEYKLKIQQEILQKDQTILQQEKKIQVFRQYNSESKHTISEQQGLMEYAENENKKLNQQVKKIQRELYKVKKDMDYETTKMKQKLELTGKQGRKQEKKVHGLERIIESFQSDLYKCVRSIQKPKVLKDNMFELYRRYGQPNHKLDVKSYNEGLRNVQHTQFFQRNMEAFMSELISQSATHIFDKNRILTTNMLLMKENNELKEAAKYLHSQVLNDQKSVKKTNTDCEEVSFHPELSPKNNVVSKKEKEMVMPCVKTIGLEENHSRNKVLQLPPIPPSKPTS